MVPKTATSTETKTITRIIHYVDKVTNQNVKKDVVQPVTLSRTKTENKVTGVVTYGEWTTGNWDEVISGKIDKYKDPDIPTVESQEVTSDSSDKEITVSPNHSYLSQLDVTYQTPDLMSHFLPPHEVSFTFCCSSIVF
ncbi:hypothetical protein L3A03_00005, partial [Streptococcus pneumoniae]|nr:hypothetical protein [Streptococcus pneumoniae]